MFWAILVLVGLGLGCIVLGAVGVCVLVMELRAGVQETHEHGEEWRP